MEKLADSTNERHTTTRRTVDDHQIEEINIANLVLPETQGMKQVHGIIKPSAAPSANNASLNGVCRFQCGKYYLPWHATSGQIISTSPTTTTKSVSLSTPNRIAFDIGSIR